MTLLLHLTGLTQRQLAECLGISRRTVQNYEAADEAPAWYTLALQNPGIKKPVTKTGEKPLGEI